MDADTLERHFRLAQNSVQIVPGSGLVLSLPDPASDVDIVSVHQDMYGIPWDEFENGAALPEPWVAKMTALAAQVAATKKGVFLSLALVGGDKRQTLADRVKVQGASFTTEPNWAAHCYDFATAPDSAGKKAAYLLYVKWMVEQFRPRYVNVAIEVNAFSPCRDAWPALVALERDAYDRAKALDPNVVAFPSIQLEALYGYNKDTCPSLDRVNCYEDGYASLRDLKRDRFAVSTYPFTAFAHVSEIPADWFVRAANRNHESLIVAETGWNSDPLRAQSGNDCLTPYPSSESDQVDYLNLVVRAAEDLHMDVVSWWNDRDLIPKELMEACQCTFDPAWCSVRDTWRSAGGPGAEYFEEIFLKLWGTTGIRRYDGTLKPLMGNRWLEIIRARGPT